MNKDKGMNFQQGFLSRDLNKVIFIIFSCIMSFIAIAKDEVSFNDFIKDKTENVGYFSFFHDNDSGKFYLEINQFEQEFLFQSSLPHGIGSNDIGLDRGQLGDTRLVQFERVGDKVFLRQLNPYYRADTNNKLEKQAIEEAFASSIIWGFKVAKISEDKKRVLIDYTPFLLSDIHGLASQLKKRKQGSYSIDTTRSAIYLKRSKAFPNNTQDILTHLVENQFSYKRPENIIIFGVTATCKKILWIL